MERHAAQPLVAAQDVRDLHEVVVDHVGEVIGREAVRLEQDRVADLVVVERLDLRAAGPRSASRPPAAWRSGSRLVAPDASSSARWAAVKVAAMPVVADDRLFARPLLLAQRIQRSSEQ